MNLADLRKVTVRKQLRIRFTLSNGMECVVNEQGIAQVPALRAVPAFNLEDELSAAQQFLVESSVLSAKEALKPLRYSRDEMIKFAAAGASPAVAHDDHED